MKYCPNCGNAVARGTVKCASCGALFGRASAWSPLPSPPWQPRGIHGAAIACTAAAAPFLVAFAFQVRADILIALTGALSALVAFALPPGRGLIAGTVLISAAFGTCYLWLLQEFDHPQSAGDALGVAIHGVLLVFSAACFFVGLCARLVLAWTARRKDNASC